MLRVGKRLLRRRLEDLGESFLRKRFGEEAVPQTFLQAHPERRVAPADFLRERILSGEPFCAGRLGNDEFEVLRQWYRGELSGLERTIGELVSIGDPWFSLFRAPRRIRYAGLRPFNREVQSQFGTLLLNSLGEVDLLGSWLRGENLFDNYLREASSCSLFDLEPYRSPRPWTQALEGKRVLVVHPFQDSIKSQFSERRSKIFNDLAVLPDFELDTLKPPQAHFSEISNAAHWFLLFEEMVRDVAQRDFEVAIIGAGPFGLPLAAEIKKMGKQAIHLGGATQILFGISGTRWKSDPIVSAMKNRAWVSPGASETPDRKARSRSPYW